MLVFRTDLSMGWRFDQLGIQLVELEEGGRIFLLFYLW